MSKTATYDKHPVLAVTSSARVCSIRWREIGERLQGAILPGRFVVVVECYPGCFEQEIERELCAALRPGLVIRAHEHYRSENEIRTHFEPDLGDDPVFGFMNQHSVQEYFDPARLGVAVSKVRDAAGLTLVIGTGAAIITREWDLLVYCDMARWEIQFRQRAKEVANLGLSNCSERPSLKYRRGYFVDWRVADRLKCQLFSDIDFLLDTNDRRVPKMISGDDLRRGLQLAATQPLRLVPFFDPGPWGGQWMKEVCDLPRELSNYAWCFDCVPEENSLLLGFGDVTIEVPSINLVFEHSRELLGEAVFARFGAEFPIRFDFLDTMDGGNLSFQVHPATEYIQKNFGMAYTQDESYYLLDAKEDATVFLGLKEGIDQRQMAADLRRALEGDFEFPAERYVNRWPAGRHDHFLIPAGTPHCSGRNSMVLEISATPYIFTFKMWDWGRLGLDGRPRPIHLEHAINNIQWGRTTGWVKKNLVNRIEPVRAGNGWCEERTGLHELEFIETRRHWFSRPVPHCTNDGVNVLNLCEGDEAVVESPTGAFQPLVVHFAETFIIPAAVGAYTIRPHGPSAGKRCATIKAFVRT